MPPPASKTQIQTSAGGVAFRDVDGRIEVALVEVGDRRRPRWQLPKGRIDPGETVEMTARREVREEAGIETELLRPLETVDFFYQDNRGPSRQRFHKFVHFFLLAYVRGDVRDHDGEVNEARWVGLDDAARMLAFESERRVLAKARAVIESRIQPARAQG